MEFTTAVEEEWLVFIREERKNLQHIENKQAYLPRDIDQNILRIALSLIVVMPIKADIKHDWHVVETKVNRLQKGWNITPPFRCTW